MPVRVVELDELVEALLGVGLRFGDVEDLVRCGVGGLGPVWYLVIVRR